MRSTCRILVALLISYDIACQWSKNFAKRVKDFPAARAELAQWIAEGKLKKTETVVRGGPKVAEQALVDLYKGINTGKLIVEIKNHNETPSKL